MQDTAADNSPSFTIRRAVPDDGPTVVRFVFATLRSYGIEPDPDGLDADVVAFGTAGDGPTLEWVAAIDASAVGSVVISPEQEGEAHLSKFFVDATHRGKGIGRALLMHAVAEARRREFRRLRLETRAIYREAVHLYEATGWVRGSDLPLGDGPERTYLLQIAP
jgi:ribosomal protein S18 acetylase RimI-like enzyme